METPECKYGYTYGQLERIVPGRLWEHYCEVSRGSTGIICEGWECRKAHGPVTYTRDVEKFFRIAKREGRL